MLMAQNNKTLAENDRLTLELKHLKIEKSLIEEKSVFHENKLKTDIQGLVRTLLEEEKKLGNSFQATNIEEITF
jgi:hypothetical protein